ncbi:MAG: tetratricopeptide repeat protein [Tannerella sp.]|jgi:tetratricopeptide (TPR) repeat protein|nr:tetratricopeptide repeat protein [Tannerella sp.]
MAGTTLLTTCGMKKNTAASRRYHALTAHYNTYFNGKTSFDESLDAMRKGHQENYTERIHMYPVSAQPKDKQETGGQFDRAIEKGNKAIKLHSIKQKPERKEGWRSDPKAIALQNKEEYNPFLRHCWMLIGQGQFYNADFLQASATFSYISRHYATDPEMVAEARIWQARCYAEMNWLFEAESMLDNLNKNGFPDANRDDYDRVYADCLIKGGRFEEAIPYLQKAIKSEKNRRQKSRMRYLLGQLYKETGQHDAAYKTFGKVAASNPPYELEFAARIRQTEVFPDADTRKILKMLNRMARNSKNKDYLDQVYYAVGNIYMNSRDTARAIENYSLGVEKSVRNGLDKAICNIRLGDIYFTRKDYVNAQPCFSEALSGIQKEHRDYDRVYRLSAVLDELVVYVESVHLQDSLQAIARMPEAERLALIDKIIEDYIEKEKKAQEEAEKERYLAEQSMTGSSLNRPGMQSNIGMVPGPPTAAGGSSFYFYDPQVVAQGKAQFQSKWGKRPLEDHWRRRNKVMAMQEENESMAEDLKFDEEGNPIIAVDSAQLLMDSLSADPKSREYYLQQIPLSEDDLEASDLIIADGLFNMGMIYKDKLENKDLAIEAFEELERRFPDNKYRMDYYYHAYLIALRYRDEALGEKYKSLLTEAFPESDYAVAVADPNYEYNIRMMDAVQDSIYETTYAAYLNGDTATVRRNGKSFGNTYPLSKLIPKFMFIDALTYVQADDVEGFKAALNLLVTKYPQADVSELAGEMLKGILQGRTLIRGNFTGMVWDLRFGLSEDGMLSAADSARHFVDEADKPHLMILVFRTGSVDKNQLLYAVAAFNFAHFTVKTFDLSFDDVSSISIMTIGGFLTLDEAIDYERMIYAPGGYAAAVERAVSFFPISDANLFTLMHGKTLEEYMTFFAENYIDRAPELIARWRVRSADDDKVTKAEDAAVEKAAGLPPDETKTENAPTTPDKSQTEEERKKEEPEQQAAENREVETQSSEGEKTQEPPAEITLDQLLERRKQAEKEEEQRLEAERKEKEQIRRDAAEEKKQQAKAREQLRRQKEKERKAALKQKEKERKEKERENRRRQKERQAARKKASKK